MNNQTQTTQQLLLDFSVLNLLPKILEELQSIKELIDISPYLTQAEVMNYLNLNSRTTLINYRNNGTFKENQEYVLENDKVIYLKKGIMNFKKMHLKGARKLRDKTEDEVLSETILKRFVA
jgi:hypothetical protein